MELKFNYQTGVLNQAIDSYCEHGEVWKKYSEDLDNINYYLKCLKIKKNRLNRKYVRIIKNKDKSIKDVIEKSEKLDKIVFKIMDINVSISFYYEIKKTLKKKIKLEKDIMYLLFKCIGFY